MTEHRAEAGRVLLVGWDGATWDLLGPWIEAGCLPNLARLVGEGASGRLRSVPTMNSGAAWSSIVTGVNPGRHGIFHLYQSDPDSYSPRPVHGSDRRIPAIWTRLSAAGVPVGVVNVPVTYPADPVDGVMISGLDAPFVDSPGVSHPPDLLSEILSRVGPYRISVHLDALARAGRHDELAGLVLETLEERLRAVLYLMRERPWRFFMCVFMESDWAQHYLWPPAGGDATASLPLRRVFERLDRALLELREAAGPNATVVLLSDHGFGPAGGPSPFLLSLLAELGYSRSRALRRKRLGRLAFARAARLLGPAAREQLVRWFPGVHRRIHSSLIRPPVDWPGTRAFTSVGGPEIFLNLRGRQPQGAVAPEDYEQLRGEIAELVSRATELDSGRPLVKRVWRREEIHHGPETDRGPDLVVEFEEIAPVSGLEVGHVAVRQTNVPLYATTGTHRMNGILVAAGPEIRRGVKLEPEGLGIYDIAPTVLHLLGQEVPEGLDGRVLAGLLTKEALARRPVRYEQDTLGPTACKRGGYDVAGEAAVLERLRGLGYVE